MKKYTSKDIKKYKNWDNEVVRCELNGYSYIIDRSSLGTIYTLYNRWNRVMKSFSNGQQAKATRALIKAANEDKN
jgi:hypothetical protein